METLSDSEKELFRDNVIRFLQTEVLPFYSGWESEEIWPRELWNKFGDADSSVLTNRLSTADMVPRLN